MDLGLTLGSLLAITILALIAAKLFPVSSGLDEGRVKRNLKRYEPDLEFGKTYVATGGKIALAEIINRPDVIGLTHLLGDRVVCRILTASDIKRVHRGRAKLAIELNDFTQPEISMVFPTDVAADAENLLNSISKPAETAHAA
ncbi:MAG: hypothetical protein HWE08_12690 [Alphaproteobacteria bacterium]|nr:hypothetical protein [Alphaproteobacteria bacterium]